MLTGFGTGLGSISDGVGDAGAPTDIERVVLRDGSSVVIRPLAVGDEAAIASWFAGLGAKTRYARLFVLLTRLDRRTQSGLARVATSTMRRSRRSPPTETRSESRAAYAPAGAGAPRLRLRWPTTGGVRHRSHPARTDRNQGARRGHPAIHRDVSCYQSRGHSPVEPARTDNGRPVRRRAGARPDRSDGHTPRPFRSRAGERRSARLRRSCHVRGSLERIGHTAAALRLL